MKSIGWGLIVAGVLALLPVFSNTALAQRTLRLDTLDRWLLNHTEITTERIEAAGKGNLYPRAKAKAQWFANTKQYRFRTKRDQQDEIERLEAKLISPILPPLKVDKLYATQIGSLPTESTGFLLIDKRNGYRIQWAEKKRLESFLVQYLPRPGSRLPVFAFYIESPEGTSWNDWKPSARAAFRRHDFSAAFVVIGKPQELRNAEWQTSLPVLRGYDLRPHLKKLKKKSAK